MSLTSIWVKHFEIVLSKLNNSCINYIHGLQHLSCFLNSLAEILVIDSHVLELKLPKIPKIHEPQENQVSCDSVGESEGQIEWIEWFSSISNAFRGICPVFP